MICLTTFFSFSDPPLAAWRPGTMWADAGLIRWVARRFSWSFLKIMKK
jgi:hypothetical protein